MQQFLFNGINYEWFYLKSKAWYFQHWCQIVQKEDQVCLKKNILR